MKDPLINVYAFLYIHYIHVFHFISTPFFSAKPGVAYREAGFEPQVCLDVCLANLRTFVYEIIKKVVLNSAMYMNRKKNIEVYFLFSVFMLSF